MEEKGIPIPKFITKSKMEPDPMKDNDVSDCVNNNFNESGKNWVNIAFGLSEEVKNPPEVNANEIIPPFEGVEEKNHTRMQESQKVEDERKIDGSQGLEDKYPKTTGGLLDAEVAKGVPVVDPSHSSPGIAAQRLVRGGGENHIVVSGIKNTATGLCGNYWTSSPGGRRKSQPPEILQVESCKKFPYYSESPPRKGLLPPCSCCKTGISALVGSPPKIVCKVDRYLV